MKATLYGLTKNKNDIHVKSQLEKMLAQVSADGATVIDGANIAAESIYGKSIVAESIEAAQIKAGAITSDHITTNGIVADKIKTGILRSTNGASWLNLNDGTFSYAKGNFTFQDGKMVVRAHTIELGGQEVPTKTETWEAINNIEIGTRNLLRDSNIEFSFGEDDNKYIWDVYRDNTWEVLGD